MAKYTKQQKLAAQQQTASLLANQPKPYTSAYQGKIDTLLNDINNRKPFSYDFNADPLYNQYKDRYQDQGKMAMMDTQAESAALSGGYGNSYGVTAGSLAYQNYLKGLNDIIPDLHDSAYNKYSQEGQDMYNRLNAYQTAESQAYNRYQHELSNYYNALDYWSAIAASGGGGRGGRGSAGKQITTQDAIGSYANYLKKNNYKVTAEEADAIRKDLANLSYANNDTYWTSWKNQIDNSKKKNKGYGY